MYLRVNTYNKSALRVPLLANDHGQSEETLGQRWLQVLGGVLTRTGAVRKRGHNGDEVLMLTPCPESVKSVFYIIKMHMMRLKSTNNHI